MNSKKLLAIVITFLLAGNMMYADIARDANGEPKHDNQIQRAPRAVFDLQKNTVSNLEFYTTNYGIFALNTALNQGSGIWPRGSRNHYIFGGGVWFAARKNRPGSQDKKNYVTVTYNPNSGGSWMVPGRISDGLAVDNDGLDKYRTYFSTDYFSSDGKPMPPTDGSSWPIWDANPDPDARLTYNRYLGWFVEDAGKRNTSTYPKGPAFISGEDIFATYKDTDLSRYEGGTAQRKQEGYPLTLQFEQMIYSWGFGDYRNLVFLSYNITNYSSDVLENCWLAPVLDVDLAVNSNLHGGAANDRVKFYDADPSLNMAFQWTDSDRGERGQGFGYLGFAFLESPAVYKFWDTTWAIDSLGNPYIDGIFERIDTNYTNFLRKDKPYYNYNEQLGLKTFRNWSIDYDPKEDDERYNFISAEIREGDTGPGDKRFMMATGPFHMRPMDTVRVVYGIIVANTTKGGDADGSPEDVVDLVRLTEFAIEVYNRDFAAPKPPDRASFKVTTGMSNAIQVTWDSTSEISKDVRERGLDFMGYRLYRARRVDLDTFDVSTVSSNITYPRGKGPLGWKQVAEWSLPTPFLKSTRKGGDPRIAMNPYLDSLRIVGPYVDANGNIIDSMAIRVMRVGKGVNLYSDNFVSNGLYLDANFRTNNPYTYAPVISDFDTSYFSQPWGPYYKSLAQFKKSVFLTDQNRVVTEYPYISFNAKEHEYILDSVLVGVAYLNRALLKYNPLLYQKKRINVDNAQRILGLPDGLVYVSVDGNLTQTVDTAYVLTTLDSATINGNLTYIVDAYVPYPKALWMRDAAQVNNALNELYTYIQENKVSDLAFREFENDSTVVYEVILPYMNKITDGRKFFDIGDDNGDGVVSYNDDPTKTEKLINNIPYYYKLLAYDEGDYTQPTPGKLNDGNLGLPNVTTVYPAAPRAERRVEFEVISVDENIGGLYNFSFYALDPERAMQLFGGDTLELEFQPYWSTREITFDLGSTARATQLGLYQRRMTLKNVTKDQLLFDGITMLEVQPGYFDSFRGLFTENAASYVLSDKMIIDSTDMNHWKYIDFGTYNSKGITSRTGKFSSGNFKEQGYYYADAMKEPAYGTLGFDFDFTVQQYGGKFRPDSITIAEAKFANGGTTPTTNAKTHIGIKDGSKEDNAERVLSTQPVDYNFFLKTFSGISGTNVHGSFNNGPGNYLVEFLPGGEETFDLEWGDDGAKTHKKFRVPYLNLRITNEISYQRPAPEKGPNETAEVKYTGEIPFMFIDTVPLFNNGGFQFPLRYYPDPRNLPFHGISTNEYIGKHNISSYGFVNARRHTNVNSKRMFARLYNTGFATKEFPYLAQGRYYLTGFSEDGRDTVDFSHALDISGVTFGLDYVNRGGRFHGSSSDWGRAENYVFGDDFKAGDKIRLKTTGGALGFPMPGAKVRVKVSQPMEANAKYTDKLLDQIQVVPNPYYVSHQGQSSPYDPKLYFTRLPKECTIDIYTITGDLVISIKHDELTSSEKDKYALNIWDLLTKNGQRIASQTLAAVISTPDGAQTIKNFSVVVGGFRILPE